MKRQIIVLAGLLTLSTALSYGITDDNPEMIWLVLDPGGRPGGMGRAFTAVADDINSTYWNPSGLARLKERHLTAMHQPRGTADLDGMFYDYMAFSYGTEKLGTFGGSVTYLDAGKQPRMTVDGNQIGTIHSYFIAPWVSWGYPLLPYLDVGANIKMGHQHLDEGATTNAFMVDFGTLYHAPVKSLLTDKPDESALNLGLTLLNIGPNVKRDIEEDGVVVETKSTPLPRMLRFGVSYKFMNDKLNDLIVSAEMEKFLMNFDGEVTYDKQNNKVYVDEGFFDKLSTELSQAIYAVGTEYWYADIVAVRFGYYYDFPGEITGFDLGVGVKYYGIGFDYSRVYEGQLFEYMNRFALSYEF
ncbi:MAG: UPF0164 family protein [bacterium]|nr:UPF0164 family protein [bacterium]